jgi:hypothetical protein
MDLGIIAINIDSPFAKMKFSRIEHPIYWRKKHPQRIYSEYQWQGIT